LFQDDRFTVLDIPDTVHSMCLMHMCDGHIIANSSFSWWAAWLGGGKCVRPGSTTQSDVVTIKTTGYYLGKVSGWC